MSDAWFDETAAMLRWNSCSGVVMLWAYFDESYEHDPTTGHAVRMTMGGCIASADNWKRLTAEWDREIAKAGIDMFHMADFEADAPPFKGWSKNKLEQRASLFDALLCLMDKYVEGYLGTFVEVAVLGKK